MPDWASLPYTSISSTSSDKKTKKKELSQQGLEDHKCIIVIKSEHTCPVGGFYSLLFAWRFFLEIH